MISERTKLSIAQTLSILSPVDAFVLLAKHELADNDLLKVGQYQTHGWIVHKITEAILNGTPNQLSSLLGELAGTATSIRAGLSPKYQFDERLWDLERCLELDGYRLDRNGRTLTMIDHNIAAAPPVEDDLATALASSRLSDEILAALNRSADDFRKQPPDLNGCLANARAASETVVRSIATRLGLETTIEGTRWGPALAFLRSEGFIAEDEEKGLAGLYRFLSPGAHLVLSPESSEQARIGRSLAALLCFFLVRRFIQRQGI